MALPELCLAVVGWLPSLCCRVWVSSLLLLGGEGEGPELPGKGGESWVICPYMYYGRVPDEGSRIEVIRQLLPYMDRAGGCLTKGVESRL
jgi:hypothetical protein